jgi:phage tail-like protein
MARNYPPVGFFFKVIFQGQFQGSNLAQEVVETSFQSVSGLNAELQTETLKEGGELRFEHILPMRSKYTTLVLKRGLVEDSKVVKWCMDAIVNFDIQPMDMLVQLLYFKRPDDKIAADKSEPLITWNVVNAWPKKWSVSDFNAEQNSITIESLELNYSYFTMKQGT